MYIFNPDNDLALANFSPHFTAPASARKMRYDLSLLPIWYTPANASVIVENELSHEYFHQLREQFSLTQTLISLSEVAAYSDVKVKPWGWNPSLRKQLIQLGINEQTLPTIKDIELLRRYSSRQNAVQLLKELKTINPLYCGNAYYYTDINQLLSYLECTSNDQLLKMPYSGSGKGLVWLKGNITDKQIDWCKRVIRMQGGVVVEPVLNKIQDFAMEFKMNNSKIEFVGYSLFKSASSGTYMGNVLLSDTLIENCLARYVGRNLLRDLKQMLTDKLSQYFPKYHGVLGVDMMICKSDDGASYYLQPCVEVNMRMNMGVVANCINENYVHPASTGLFSINFFKRREEAQEYTLSMESKKPLIVENGKIKRGFLSLTPVDRETQYIATVSIKQNHEKEL